MKGDRRRSVTLLCVRIGMECRSGDQLGSAMISPFHANCGSTGFSVPMKTIEYPRPAIRLIGTATLFAASEGSTIQSVSVAIGTVMYDPFACL